MGFGSPLPIDFFFYLPVAFQLTVPMQDDVRFRTAPNIFRN
jgi:hypothetical protein